MSRRISENPQRILKESQKNVEKNLRESSKNPRSISKNLIKSQRIPKHLTKSQRFSKNLRESETEVSRKWIQLKVKRKSRFQWHVTPSIGSFRPFISYFGRASGSDFLLLPHRMPPKN